MKKFIFLFSFFLIPTYLFADTIRVKGGENLQGVVVDSETAQDVTYHYQGTNAPQKVSSEQVEEVEFSDPNPFLKKGMAAFYKRDYSSAEGEFSKVRGDKFKPYGVYYAGESLRLMEKYEAAVAAFKEFESIDHRLTPHAFYQLGATYLQARQYSQAVQAFQKLTQKDYGDFWKAKANYGMASAYLAEKKYGEAKSKFDDVYRQSRGKEGTAYKELAGLAEQGKGLAMVGSGDYSGAKTIFFRIVKDKYATSEALAGSYLGLGKVYLSMAEKGGSSQENYEKAVLCFLRVIMFYSGYKDKYIEALNLGAQCFEKLGQNDRAQQLKGRIPG